MKRKSQIEKVEKTLNYYFEKETSEKRKEELRHIYHYVHHLEGYLNQIRNNVNCAIGDEQ